MPIFQRALKTMMENVLSATETRNEQIVVEDLATAEAVERKVLLEQLNQSTIKRLQNFMKDDPSIDMWLHLRAVAREYGEKRVALTEKPAVELEGDVRMSIF